MALNGGQAGDGDVPDLDPRQVERLLQIATAMSEAQEKATGNPKLDMAGLMAALAVAEKEDGMVAGGILNGGGKNGEGGRMASGGNINGGRKNEEAISGAKVVNGGATNKYQTQNSFLHSNFSSSSSSSSCSSVTDSSSSTNGSNSYNFSNVNNSKNIQSYSEKTTIQKESYESKQTVVSGQMTANSLNSFTESAKMTSKNHINYADNLNGKISFNNQSNSAENGKTSFTSHSNSSENSKMPFNKQSNSAINVRKSFNNQGNSTVNGQMSINSQRNFTGNGKMSISNQDNSSDNDEMSANSKNNNMKDASFLYPNDNDGGRLENAVTSIGGNVRNKKAMFEGSSTSNSSTVSSEPSPVMANKFNNKVLNNEKRSEHKISSVNASSEEVHFEVRKNETTTSDNIFKKVSQNSKDHESRILKEYGSGAALLNGSYHKKSNGTTSRPLVHPPAPPSGIQIMPNDITKLEFSKPAPPPPPPPTEPPKPDTANYREQFRMKPEAFDSKPKRLGPKPFHRAAKYNLAEPVNVNTKEDNKEGNAYAGRLGLVSHGQDMLSRPAAHQPPSFQTVKFSLIHELKSKIDGEPEMEKPKPSGVRKDMGINSQQSKALTNLLMQINSGGEDNNGEQKATNGGINQRSEVKKVVSGGRTEEENSALMKKLVYTQYREMLKSYNNEAK